MIIQNENVYNRQCVEEVAYLPDAINVLKASSDTLNRINNKQSSLHELTLSEYKHDIKYISSQTIEPNLNLICNNANKEMHDVLHRIDKVHFPSLHRLNNFTSVDQFNETWNKIKYDINEIYMIIDGLNEDLIECEKTRLEMIKEILSIYFDRFKSHGKWDLPKIVEFLNDQSVVFNHQAICHYQEYFHLTANLKIMITKKTQTYRQSWEQLLLAWRDYLVKTNVDVIEDIIQSGEYKSPKTVNELRIETYEKLEEIDSTIMNMYRNVVVRLPYNRQELTTISNQVDKQLEDKSILKESFLSKSKIHYDSLVDKLEKRLLDMKDFLFREASCSNSQFLKTFSKFVGDSPESYEMSVEKIQDDDNILLTSNLKLMGDVHCSLQRFLYSICDLWDGNDEKVKVQKCALLNTLEDKRQVQEDAIRILEYNIDKSVSKILNCKSHRQLDKIQESITSDLNKLESQFELFNAQVMTLIRTYPGTCIGQIEGYESGMLNLIGMQKCESEVTVFHYEVDNKKFMNCPDGQIDITHQEMKGRCDLIKAEARLYLIKHIVSNGEDLLKQSKSLVISLTNEISKEHDLRISLHKPRKNMIISELSARKTSIDNFKDTFQQYCDIASKYEECVTSIEERFNSTANVLIRNIQHMSETAETEYLKTTKSVMLREQYYANDEKFSKEESKLQDISKTILTELEKEFKIIKNKEENLIEYAAQGNFDICEKSKLYQEFCGIKDMIKMVTTHTKKLVKNEEFSKKKQINVIIQQHKAYYKHCLLGLYFQEMKSKLLSHCRLKIKSVISYGNKDLRDTNNMINNLKSQMKTFSGESEWLSSHTDQICGEYVEIFQHFRKMINCLNYRCSTITVPQNKSLFELNKKYESFGSADADVTKTIEFSKEILNMTSLNAVNDRYKQSGEVDAVNEWVPNKADVEKKYITGRLGCIYGVGANLMDIPTHPWAGVCATLTTSCKSFWLSKSPQGLMALEEIKEKRREQRTEPKTDASSSTDSQTSDHDLKVRNISKKIRKSITPDMPSNPFSNQRGTNSLSDKLRRLKTLTEGIMRGDEDGLQIRSPSHHQNLPSVDSKVVMYTSLRRHSGNQIDMQKAMTLSKTVDLMYKARRKKSFPQKKAQKIPIYDFMIMEDKELEQLVFEPASFFQLNKRSYQVDDLSQTIVSTLEKVKFYLFHLQEDYIIACIVFYRQKHLCIKYPQKICPTLDSAIEKFRVTLESYLNETRNHCHKSINMLKSSLGLVYELFEESATIIFTKIYSESIRTLLQQYKSYTESLDDEKKKNDRKKNELWNCLRPCLSLPQNQSKLETICVNETKRGECIAESLKDLYQMYSANLTEHHERYVSETKYFATEMLKVVDEAIQIEDIRRITTNESNTFEVKVRLRKNLHQERHVTHLNKMTVYTPLPEINVSDTANPEDTEIIGVEHMSYNKMNITRHRLKYAVVQQHDKFLFQYRSEYNSKMSKSKDIYDSVVSSEKHWSKRWRESIAGLKNLVKMSEFEE